MEMSLCLKIKKKKLKKILQQNICQQNTKKLKQTKQKQKKYGLLIKVILNKISIFKDRPQNKTNKNQIRMEIKITKANKNLHIHAQYMYSGTNVPPNTHSPHPPPPQPHTSTDTHIKQLSTYHKKRFSCHRSYTIYTWKHQNSKTTEATISHCLLHIIDNSHISPTSVCMYREDTEKSKTTKHWNLVHTCDLCWQHRNMTSC